MPHLRNIGRSGIVQPDFKFVPEPVGEQMHAEFITWMNKLVLDLSFLIAGREEEMSEPLTVERLSQWPIRYGPELAACFDGL